jgi:hypothetical protein
VAWRQTISQFAARIMIAEYFCADDRGNLAFGGIGR